MNDYEWLPDAHNDYWRWRQRRMAKKYGPPKMSWEEAVDRTDLQLSEDLAKHWPWVVVGLAVMGPLGFFAAWIIVPWL